MFEKEKLCTQNWREDGLPCRAFSRRKLTGTLGLGHRRDRRVAQRLHKLKGWMGGWDENVASLVLHLWRNGVVLSR